MRATSRPRRSVLPPAFLSARLQCRPAETTRRGYFPRTGEIAATPDDLVDALRRYEQKVTPFPGKAKELPGGGIDMMLSHSRFGTAVQRTVNRAMMSRAMRPDMMKMFFGKTDDYELPTC